MELKYLEMLNQEQLRAVKIKDNCVVSAGAGSGKTRVLAKRFVYMLIERNIPIEKIAALTFTKKAAMERAAFVRFGGNGGIRTHGTLRFN